MVRRQRLLLGDRDAVHETRIVVGHEIEAQQIWRVPPYLVSIESCNQPARPRQESYLCRVLRASLKGEADFVKNSRKHHVRCIVWGFAPLMLAIVRQSQGVVGSGGGRHDLVL